MNRHSSFENLIVRKHEFYFYTKKEEPLTNGFAPKRGGTGNSDAASFDNDFYLIIRILPVYLIHIPSVDRTDLL